MAIKIPKLTKEQQQYIVLAVLMLGGFGYSFFTFFWIPVSEKIAETKKKAEDVRGRIEKATRQAGRLPRLEQELIALNEQAVEAEKRLPRQKSTPDILVTIGALAEKHNVTLVSFTPGGAAQRNFFSELQYPVQVTGKFHNIGRFLAAIALEERIFNVQNVVFGTANPEGEMSVNFTLLSYQYQG